MVVDQERNEELKHLSRDWPSWDLTPRQICDLELLANGGFSPLQEFLCRNDYESVCEKMRLAGGKKYTPAVTVPLIHTLLTLLLRQACDCEHPDWEIRSAQRKSRRKELARFYHYKKRNLLAPLRLKQRR